MLRKNVCTEISGIEDVAFVSDSLRIHAELNLYTLLEFLYNAVGINVYKN